MTISDQIRATLQQCGEPMTLQQISDANSWDKDERIQASKNLYNMKKAGEIVTELTEEKVHYALAAGYVARRARAPELSTAADKPAPKRISALPAAKREIRNPHTGNASVIVADGAAADTARLTRSALLGAADKIVSRDRNATHGKPEDSFAHIAAMWSGYLGIAIRPHDVAAMMAALKLARIRSNPSHADNWIDLAGYAACGAEVAPA